MLCISVAYAVVQSVRLSGCLSVTFVYMLKRILKLFYHLCCFVFLVAAARA